MQKILITGATGNIGNEVIKYLFEFQTENEIFAGVRNIEEAKKKFANYNKLQYTKFDFENTETFEFALKNMDIIFLVRPPHISDIAKIFNPLINSIKQNRISKIVFLSVQGVEKSSVIPHNKIEKLIINNEFNFVFLRPSYFMQNLTTTLFKDIKEKQKIILPSGNAKFNWIDIKNIAETSSIILENFDKYKNQTFEITGYENENFYKIKDLFKDIINLNIRYDNANPIRFYLIKKKDKMPIPMIIVMIMLHFLPRFQQEPKISNFYEQITNKKPTTIKQFLIREQAKFTD